MTYLQSFSQRTKRPMAFALTVALGGTGGLMIGKAQAADLPDYSSPAPQPYVEQRVETSFARFGPYIGVRGGAAIADDTSFSSTAPAVGTITNEYEDWNLTGSAFAGYEMEFFPGFGGRIEAELGYASLNIEDHLQAGASLAGADGDTTVFSGMVNAYVDANLGAFRPFAGVGLGMAQVNFNDHSTTADGILMDNDDTNFAWQVSGGIGYDLTDRITLEGLVRYQSIMDVELTSTAAGGSLTSSTDLNTTSAMLGMRYRF